jgi:CBS domain containing-hemolysin-like protein
VGQVYENVSRLILMILLLGCSAFFSGSETALFNLSRRQIRLLQESTHKMQNLAAGFANKPRQLLSCLLFGNMAVNILFYAVSSVFIFKVKQQAGPGPALIIAFATFCFLVLFGEILPKSFAYANSKSFSITAALPLALCVRIFSPIVFFFRFLIVEPTLNLILGARKKPKTISTAEFKSLIEQMRKRELITDDENRLLGEIIELGFLKVRHVMRPRVDIIACAVTDSNSQAVEKMLKNHLTKLPVYVETIDNTVGQVYLRQLLLKPTTSLDRLVQAVHFVPEQQKVESLLEHFRRSHSDTAIAVDEYGGIAGSVCLEDIAEELLGPITVTNGIEPIEQIGPFQYRLAGNLAIHDWAHSFNINPVESRISTIGGLVTALLGKIPKSDDVAHLKNLRFTVERVHKRRIETVILTLEPILNND